MKNGIKGCLVVLIVLLLVIILAVAMCGGEEKLPKDLTDEEAFVAGIVGYKSSHKDYESKLFDVKNHGTALDIRLIGDEYLSPDAIRRGMLRDTRDIFATVFEEYPEMDSVYIYWRYPLVDKLGNVELSEVMRIGLYRETAEAINWPHFDIENFPAVADNYWQHSALD